MLKKFDMSLKSLKNYSVLKSAVIAIPAQSDLGRLAEVSHQFSRAFRALSGRALRRRSQRGSKTKTKTSKKVKGEKDVSETKERPLTIISHVRGR